MYLTLSSCIIFVRIYLHFNFDKNEGNLSPKIQVTGRGRRHASCGFDQDWPRFKCYIKEWLKAQGAIHLWHPQNLDFWRHKWMASKKWSKCWPMKQNKIFSTRYMQRRRRRERRLAATIKLPPGGASSTSSPPSSGPFDNGSFVYEHVDYAAHSAVTAG